MRSKLSKLIPVKELVLQILRGESIPSSDSLRDIKNQWPQCVGPELENKIFPLKIRGKCLFVEVPHPTWAHQFEFLKEGVLQKLRQSLPQIILDDIRCQIVTRPSGK